MEVPPVHQVIVAIPTYNTGPGVEPVVCEVLEAGHHVIVVVDGSTDGTAERLEPLRAQFRALEILTHDDNRGKGAAVLSAGRRALELGGTHLLTFDADGQHPVASIPEFIRCSAATPAAMVLGAPVFGPEAPWERVAGRRVGNWWTNFLSVYGGMTDSLFGMRLYPLAPLVEVLSESRLGHRYDLECVAAVKLRWRGIPVINLPAPVKYLSAAEGGVSHYRYLRDNLRMAITYARLLTNSLKVRFSRRSPPPP
jgi:glycosyltransferase involved in cell wall biosynthesis